MTLKLKTYRYKNFEVRFEKEYYPTLGQKDQIRINTDIFKNKKCVKSFQTKTKTAALKFAKSYMRRH